MAKRFTVEQAEEVLRGEDGRATREVLAALPEGVDPQLVAGKALGFARHSTWRFARLGRRLHAPIIRAMLGQLATDATPLALFLRQLVGDGAALSDEALRRRWERALTTLLDLDTTYAWGSKQRRAKLAGVAKDPELLAAIQAAVVGGEASLDMLAVLAIDGSEASADALLPLFTAAAKEQGGDLDRLKRLRTHASDTPAITAMLAQVDALLGARNARSPALELARHIGLEVEVFWAWAFLGSSELNRNNVPCFQSNMHIDSRAAGWFAMSLSEVTPDFTKDHRGISFTAEKVHHDSWKLGPCEPRDLPAWMAKAAKTLGFTWDLERFDPRTNLRGKKRERLREWLRGG